MFTKFFIEIKANAKYIKVRMLLQKDFNPLYADII